MVVEVVGATASGPTSFQCGRMTGAAALWAKVDPELPVMATIGISHTIEVIDHRLQLRSLTALRNQDSDIALCSHAQVAMDRLRQVQKGRSRARGRERRCDLPCDVTRLAQAADDQLASAIEDQIDGALELLAKSIRKCIERSRLVVENLAPELEQLRSSPSAAIGLP